jgi:hypothetical protein
LSVFTLELMTEKTSKQDNNLQMHVDLMFPSRYLKAADFEGKPVALTISEPVALPFPR